MPDRYLNCSSNSRLSKIVKSDGVSQAPSFVFMKLALPIGKRATYQLATL